MSKFRYIDDLLASQSKSCAHPNCRELGEHRAPISPDRPGEYQFLCLNHVKEFNKGWDYFKEKSSDEIIEFQKDAFTGHRPTWRMHPDPRHTTHTLNEALHRFRHGSEALAQASFAPPLNAKDRAALEQLDLGHPVDQPAIKKQYKKLARRYHPDRNQGDKKAEEHFKAINSAYRHLIDHYCGSISAS